MKRYLLFGFGPYYEGDDTTPFEGWNAFENDYDNLEAVMVKVDKCFYNGPWCHLQIIDTLDRRVIMTEKDLISADKYKQVQRAISGGYTPKVVGDFVCSMAIPFENWELVLEHIPSDAQEKFIERMVKYNLKALRREVEEWAAEHA